MFSPANDCSIALNTAATASGTTTITSAIVDMQGYDSCLFLTTLGTVNAGNFFTVAEGNASDLGDGANLAGSKVTPTGTGPSEVILAVERPAKRYLQLTVTRGSASTIGDIHVIRYNAHKQPVTNSGTAAFVNVLNSPAEGTP